MTQEDFFTEIIVDNFAGGGGASTGIELATGRPVTIAINHDPDAILMHKTNHPFAEHYQASVWDINPVKVCRGRPVGLAWFSPDCKHFSKAKGAALVDRNIRGLAWIVLRWAGTVRPRVIILENVEEFVTWGPVRKGKPVRKLAGTTFSKWKQQLLNLGYTVEHRELIAADYGAPTTRKRFVLVARCDGKPIVWPERTHAPADHPDTISGKYKPWRGAWEVLEFSLPMYSVFANKQEIKEKYGVNVVRPLAENTMRRVIRSVDKFTIKSGKPFLVECNHSGGGHVADVSRPIGTITAKHTEGICAPLMAPVTFSNTGGSVGTPASEPISTIRTSGGEVLSAAQLVQYHTERSEAVRGQNPTDPLQTVDSSNRYGLLSANLVEYFSTGRPLNVTEPMHTATTKERETLSAAHIVEFKGQDIGQSPDRPLRTITASAGEFAFCSSVIAKYGTEQDLGHWPQIRALLNKHCGYELKDDEIIILVIGGVAYYIRDIVLRMLIPRELASAMGCPEDYILDKDYLGNEYTRTKQVARIGNMVCPPMAEAVVRANYESSKVVIETMSQLNELVSA